MIVESKPIKKVFGILKDRKGIALGISLIFLTILSLIGAAGIITSTIDTRIASNNLSKKKALYIAEAGLTRTEAELINDLNSDQNMANSSFVTLSGVLGITPGSTAFYTVFNNTPFARGSYTVKFKNYGTPPNYDPKTVLVRSTGTGPNSSAVILEKYLSAENISPWNNAIFVDGGGNIPITGNVIIAGSIHLLGVGLASTDTVFDNQTGDCRNSNAGMDGSLSSAINGGVTSNLKSKFRVKNGRVDMTLGSATIGSSANSFKGIYITGGKDANSNGVNDDILGGDNTGAGRNIFAEKGACSAEAYDLGNVYAAMPSINTTYMDNNSIDLTGITENEGLIGGALILNGNILVPPPGHIYDINQSGISPSGKSCSIVFNGATNVLTISGIVKVTSLTINDDIKYLTPSGGGTIYVTGTTLIDGNALPAAPASYPTTNVLGVVSAGDITLGSSASVFLLTGAYYSAGAISSSKKMELAGTIVCRNFNITGQIPRIWQVPSLAGNLPPGMPASTPIWAFTDKTWREITRK